MLSVVDVRLWDIRHYLIQTNLDKLNKDRFNSGWGEIGETRASIFFQTEWLQTFSMFGSSGCERHQSGRRAVTPGGE